MNPHAYLLQNSYPLDTSPRYYSDVQIVRKSSIYYVRFVILYVELPNFMRCVR
jgi:hypothetical protein